MLLALLDFAAEILFADLRLRVSRARVTVCLLEADIRAMRGQDWGN